MIHMFVRMLYHVLLVALVSRFMHTPLFKVGVNIDALSQADGSYSEKICQSY